MVVGPPTKDGLLAGRTGFVDNRVNQPAFEDVPPTNREDAGQHSVDNSRLRITTNTKPRRLHPQVHLIVPMPLAMMGHGESDGWFP